MNFEQEQKPDAIGWYAVESAPLELFDGRRVQIAWKVREDWCQSVGNYVLSKGQRGYDFRVADGVWVNPTHIRPLGPPPMEIQYGYNLPDARRKELRGKLIAAGLDRNGGKG